MKVISIIFVIAKTVGVNLLPGIMQTDTNPILITITVDIEKQDFYSS